MANKPGPKPGRRFKNTTFERTYGVHRNDFAQSECVSPDAITMRLKNFGTPYQRRAKPTFWETHYGRTLYELAEEVLLHPQTLKLKHDTHGSVFVNTDHGKTKQPHQRSVQQRWREAVQSGDYWRKQSPWLHPLHPDYDAWRTGKLFADEHVGGSQLTAPQIEQLMKSRGWEKY